MPFQAVLLSIPSPEINVFDLGLFGVKIHVYALCLMLGMLLATIVTNARLTRRGGEPWISVDFAFWTIIFGVIGARTYHVLTHPNDYFYEGAELLKVFAINEGGIAIFGGMLGGAIGALIACRISGIRFWSFVDALVPGLLLAQACGRLGNWFNQELFGSPTTLPWGLEIDATNPAFPLGLPEDTLFHPTFLYEILWNLLGIVVILSLESKLRSRWGTTFGMYLIWYGIGRAWLETLRLDPIASWFGLRLNLWTALLAICVGLMIIIVQRSRHPGIEPSVYRPGRIPAQYDEQLQLNEVYRLELGRAGTAAADAAEAEAEAEADAHPDAEADAHPDAEADAQADAAEAGEPHSLSSTVNDSDRPKTS